MFIGVTFPAGQYHSTVLPSLDFETYSEAGYLILPSGKVVGAAPSGKGGLPVVGVPVYAEHPSTEVLSVAYDLKDGAGVRLWAPGLPSPTDLIDHVANGGAFEAHNATFEWYIWNLVCCRKLSWPPLLLHQIYCSKAKAKAFSLPGALGLLAQVLGTAGKDKKGSNLIRKLCVPLTPTKNRQAHRWTPATAWPDFVELYDYNKQDVVAEDAASLKMPDLTPYERKVWLADQTINARGIPLDIKSLDAAIDVLRKAADKYNCELSTVTKGAVTSVNQNKRFIEWVNSRGVHTSSLDEKSRAELLKRDGLLQDVKKALEIANLIMSANVKKLYTFKLQVSSDGRLRDQYSYCGADRTGRWSAGGAQVQNITSKGPETCECESCEHFFGAGALKKRGDDEDGCPRCGSFLWHKVKGWPVGAVKQALVDVQSGELEHVERVWGSPVEVLCGCLRGLFRAKEGHKFICCDFSAIEAVAQACLSRCSWRIEVFRTHGKIYEASASKASGIPFEEILNHKKLHGSDHPLRKKVGKVRELAGGYGGWIGAWKNFGADDYFTSDDMIKEDVLKWREESPEIVEMWGGQYRWTGPGKWDFTPELFGMEGAAIAAVLYPGARYQVHDAEYFVEHDILYCRLPSGRLLHYHRPRLVEVQDRLNRGPAWQITFEGYNSNPQKGPIGWGRWETFGGRLFENYVQAVSRDIQAEAILNVERAGYPVVLHSHDEICCEVPDTQEFTLERMLQLVTHLPTWASWWPLKAAGWEDYIYQKD